MFSRVTPLVLALAVTANSAEVPRVAADPEGVVVHEWGTFTSIAGADGQPVLWTPLDGESDLPCFVHHYRSNIKAVMSATVRMETPVLYFYSPQLATVDVTVRFNQGLITEWFPWGAHTLQPATLNLAAGNLQTALRWEQVRIAPKATPAFPAEPGDSHYYAARATDAAPLAVGREQDRFLFYRGIARFGVPLTAAVEPSGRLLVKPTSEKEPVGRFVLFANDGGRISYRVGRGISQATTLEMPAERGSFALLRSELEQLLIAEGLYAKEATAMVETWKDSWFEGGTRLLYIVPPPMVDRVLPLEITPQPSAVARVFVGRMEIVTPEMVDRVREALKSGDVPALAKHGRFLQAIVDRVLGTGAPQSERTRVSRLMQSAYAMNVRGARVCTR